MTTIPAPELWEDFPLHVNVLVIGSDPETGEVLSEELVHNLIVTSGKVLVTRMLMEESGFDTGITYCEVGTDNTAAVIGDTDLNTGTKRNVITSTIRTSNEVQFRTFFAAADITDYLKEVGLFGHSTASSTLGTGELFNRAIIDFDNSAGTKDMTIVIQLTVG
jgi:hypothetical protein